MKKTKTVTKKKGFQDIRLNKAQWITLVVMILACIAVTKPMSLNWVWNEASWGHHGQYEKMTDAILSGHLYMDYDVDPKLLELENPYDRGQREANGVAYEFDHAYYDGHYYMYFGIVPVFLVCIPLRLLGIYVTSTDCTQIMAVGAIVGLFALFYAIYKKYAPKLPLATYLCTSCAVSFISLWYAVKYPSLYCTAITSGVCMAVWGVYFCFKAFVVDTEFKKTILHAALGASFSALVFGCRPTIGFISLLYIPMIVHYVKENYAMFFGKEKGKIVYSWKEIGKIVAAFALPYVITAILLMIYNYVRFDNPFEFGQTYQLTLVDQSFYMDDKPMFGPGWLAGYLNDFLFYFVKYTDVSDKFPYIHEDGMLVLFPILLLGGAAFRSVKREKGTENFVKGFGASVIATVLIIILMQSRWAPFEHRRYTTDFAFMLGILMMFGICRIFMDADEKKYKTLNWVVSLACVGACIVAALLFFTTGESAMADMDPGLPQRVADWLFFWKK